MSFTNTPLGQQRRLDRQAFFNGTKKQVKASKLSGDSEQAETQQTSPPRRAASTHTIPVSYSYGAPELSRSSTSPPKPSPSSSNRPPSPTRSTTTTSQHDPAEDPNSSSEPANVRYARLKQRNQALGPTASTSSSTSRGLDLRDTSVNVANAFTQAAFSQYGTMPKPKSSASWTSGNRLVPPPASGGFRRSVSVLAEEEAEVNVDESGDVDVNGDPISRTDRGKSPFFNALGAAGTYIVNQAKRATSRQPEDSASTTGIQQSLSSVDRTSDYEDAEALYQRAKAGLAPSSPPGSKTSSAAAAAKKKPRKSRDNALYKPAPSDSEESDGVDSDEGKRRKKAKQVKGLVLPVIGPSKTVRTKKLRKQSSRPGASILGEGDLRSVSSIVQVDEEPSVLPPSRGRTRSRSRSHTPRAQSVGGQTTDSYAEEMNLDDALNDDDPNAYSDLETQKQSQEIAAAQQAALAQHAQSRIYPSIPKRGDRGVGVGAALGTLVRLILSGLAALKKMNFDPKNPAWIVVALLTAYAMSRSFGGSQSVKPVPSKGYEHVPMPAFDLPPGTLEELIERLAILEKAQRSTDTAIGDVGSRVGHMEGRVGGVDARIGLVDTRMGQVEGRVGNVEGRVVRVDERVEKVDGRIDQVDSRVGQVDSRVEQFGARVAKVDTVVGQVDARVGQVDSRVGQVDSRVGRMDTWVAQADTRMDQLGSRVGHVEQAGPRTGNPDGKAGNVDGRSKEIEARAREIEAKAKEVEGHAKRFEGRAKEIESKTKEIDTKAKEIDAKTKELDARSREHDVRSRDFESKLREIEAKFKDAGASWWPRNRPGSQQHEQLAIGSEAAEQIVQRAVLAATKDTVARADFALYTGGGRVIPEYTSPTFSVSPVSGWRRMLGIGTVYGRAPAVALVPDINVGNCWSFAGSQGQIAVLLSRTVKVDSVTVDHASKDVAYDLRAAPRKFAVWGLVEGADNLEKLAKYHSETEAQSIGGAEGGVDEADGPQFKPARILLAEFEYDINSSSHIQTFTVSDRVRETGIDVGVVVFQVRSSWGDPNFTCLYRVRVHGEAVGPNVSQA